MLLTEPPGPVARQLQASYVLPLKAASPTGDELTAYLRRLTEIIEVVVVDGSDPEVFAVHHEAWRDAITHVPVTSVRLNGKVAGVIDGLAAATYDCVVIADDDVRYDPEQLRRLVEGLKTADVVVPQNYFEPRPWHARWDTGRSLLNRSFGVDFAGTLGLRRSALPDGEYCGAVLFENLELLRTVRAAGGRVRHERGLYVLRQPPTVGNFWQQRTRQAYDSFAQPGRFAVELSALPLAAGALRSAAGRRTVLGAGIALVALAEVGRRRAGGSQVFPLTAPLWAPVWVVERAVTSWLAVYWRLRGGVPYAGGRHKIAAHHERDLTSGRCPRHVCACRPCARGAPRVR